MGRNRARPFGQRHAYFGSPPEKLGLFDEGKPKSFRGIWIVAGDRLNDLLQVALAPDGEDYLPAHERTASRS